MSIQSRTAVRTAALTLSAAALGLSADLHTWEMIDLVVGGIFGPLQFAIDDVA